MKTVIEMAREATNGRVAKNDAETESLIGLDEVTRFAELVRAVEREAIINLVAMYGGSVDLEAAIRARGNT